LNQIARKYIGKNKVKVLGFAGSLRRGSYNKALLRAAADLLPEDMNLEIFDIEGITAFNQDTEENMPLKVKEFKAKIREADAILIATPEYNYSVPGVLKNAIDWGSRPYGDNSFDGKPVAIMSASVGIIGGARAQYHLRQMFVFLNMYPINRPEVIVSLHRINSMQMASYLMIIQAPVILFQFYLSSYVNR
jgi:chromate reductase, NAD(P)H dehydrogenase (quinone)